MIARCSQPEVGLLGWRNEADEKLLRSFVEACQKDPGTRDLHAGDPMDGKWAHFVGSLVFKLCKAYGFNGVNNCNHNDNI